MRYSSLIVAPRFRGKRGGPGRWNKVWSTSTTASNIFGSTLGTPRVVPSNDLCRNLALPWRYRGTQFSRRIISLAPDVGHFSVSSSLHMIGYPHCYPLLYAVSGLEVSSGKTFCRLFAYRILWTRSPYMNRTLQIPGIRIAIWKPAQLVRCESLKYDQACNCHTSGSTF